MRLESVGPSRSQDLELLDGETVAVLLQFSYTVFINIKGSPLAQILPGLFN